MARAVPARWVWVPLLLAAALVVLDLTTDLDRSLSRSVYYAASADFPLRTNFWLDVVMHHWVKYAVATVGWLTAAAFILSFALPALRFNRRTLGFLVLAIVLAPASVVFAKSSSSRHCPWDVDEFGGYAPYSRIFDTVAPATRPGHCFPAGHASTGFALMAFYFAAYRARRRVAARLALAGGISAGMVLGYGRVLQGAHFASHVAWSGLLCWAVMVALYALVFGRESAIAERRHDASPLHRRHPGGR